MLSRYSTVQAEQINLPRLNIPLELVQGQINQAQGSLNTFDSLASLVPDVIEQSPSDVKLRNQFVDWTENIRDQVSAAFASGDTSKALRVLANAKNEMVRESQPGGVSNFLMGRAKSYRDAKAAMDKQLSTYKDPSYRTYFDAQLNSQLNQKDIWDANTRSGKSINAPNMFGEVNTHEEASKHLKNIFPNQEVSIINDPKRPGYFQKITVKGVSEDEVRKSLDSFFSRPDIQQAVDVQSFATQAKYDPATQQALTKVYNAKNEKKLGAITEKLKGVVNQLDKLNKTSKGKKSVDGILAQYGVSSIDELRERSNSTYQPRNPEQMFKETTVDQLSGGLVSDFSYMQKDVDLIADKVRLAKMKNATAREANDIERTRISAQTTPNALSFDIVGGKTNPVKISKVIADTKKAIDTTTGSFNSGLKPLLGDDYENFNEAFNVTESNSNKLVPAISKAYDAYKIAEAAGKSGKDAYFSSMRRNGFDLSGQESKLKKQISMLQNQGVDAHVRDFQQNYDKLNTTLNLTKGSVSNIVNKYPGNIFEELTIPFTSNELFPTTAMGFPTERRPSTPEELRKLYNEGDPRVLQAIEEKGKEKMSSEEFADTRKVLSGFYSDDKYSKELAGYVNLNLDGVIQGEDFLNSEIRDKFQKDGTWINGTKAESVTLAYDLDNGKHVPNLVVKLANSKASETIIVPINFKDDSWSSDMRDNLAMGAINPTTKEIDDEQMFNSLAAVEFDNQTTSSASLGETRELKYALNSDESFTPLADVAVGGAVLNQAVVKQGGKKYFITASPNMDIQGIGDYNQMLKLATENPDDYDLTIELIKSENNASLNAASLGAKASWMKKGYYEKLTKTPWDEKRSKTIVTPFKDN